MIHEFGLETLPELDGGRVAIAWKQALQRVAKDCEDRPAEKKTRKVILELELEPVFVQEDGVLDSIHGSFRVKDSVPTRQSKTYSFGYRKKRGDVQLVFNDMSEGDIHQRTIDEED